MAAAFTARLAPLKVAAPPKPMYSPWAVSQAASSAEPEKQWSTPLGRYFFKSA